MTSTNQDIEMSSASDVKKKEESNRETNSGTDRGTFSNRNTFSGLPVDYVEEAMKRTMTSFGVDMEEEWTKGLLTTYQLARDQGAEGDVPLPVEFIRNKEFWKCVLVSGTFATIIGLAALGFLNFADILPRVWTNISNNGLISKDDNYFSCPPCATEQAIYDAYKGNNDCLCYKYSNCFFYAGDKKWIFFPTLAGIVVGIIRYISGFPDNPDGLFKEILTYHVEPKLAPWAFIISMISLGGGASLGPEQALATLGGGVGTFFSQSIIHFEDDGYQKLMVLSGMAASLGALFPTPILGVLLLLELGNMPKTYMESILVMSIPAIISYMVYYSLVNDSFESLVSSEGIIFSIAWEYNLWNCGTAVILGVVCAALGLCLMLFIGITKQIFNRIRMRLSFNRFLQCVIPPFIGGLCVGTVNWALPLTVGNGSFTISPVISYGGVNLVLSQKLLICTAIAKAFLLGVCMNCGFIGGFIFPMLFIGACVGVIAYLQYPLLPLGLTLGCFMAGIPSAIVPAPYTMSILIIFVFYFGLYETVPIFITSIVAYTIVVGSGIFGALQRRANPDQYKSNTNTNTNTNTSSKNATDKAIQQLEDDYAFKKYNSPGAKFTTKESLSSNVEE